MNLTRRRFTAGLLSGLLIASTCTGIGLVVQSSSKLFLVEGGGGGGDTITWNSISHPAFVGFRVYYGTASGEYDQDPGEGEDVGTDTEYDVSAFAADTWYFIVVWYDEFGNESPPSNELEKVIP